MHPVPAQRARAARPAFLALLIALSGPSLPAGGPPKKTFSIPAEPAGKSLTTFADQAGAELLFSTETAAGVRTNAVQGSLDPARALSLLLAGTGLSAVYDRESGVYRISRSAAQPEAQKKSPSPAVDFASGAAPSSDETSATIALSPFVVNASQDQGYLANSTMSGTRLNTAIQDIPAAVSVITKEQILDTAAVDINDVFLYEANTEGTYQWTSFTNDRGTVSDDVQENPMGATRVRGLTAANVAADLFPTALPFDTYDVDSLEISRGPNSSIFGIGNTGGTVNVNESRANPTREFTTLRLRGDSYGGYRATIDVNRPLVADKLAIRVLGLYNAEGYLRKPAADKTRRAEALLTAHPFPTTTVRASFESFREFSNRPNSMTPEDGITDWMNDGRPTYDPVGQTVHFANGTSVGPISPSNESKLLPFAIQPANTALTQYPSWYIDGGRVRLNEINALPSSTGVGPNDTKGSQHILQDQTFYDAFSNQYPLYRTPGITNKGLYDWTRINLAAPNYASTKAETDRIEVEQFLLHTPTQTLAFQGGWQHQHLSTDSRDFLGSYSGGKYEVLVDLDERLLDGTPNPYFLRPYLGASQPAYTKSFNYSNIYRGTLAYELDFEHKDNWLRWLGRQRFTGYGEYDAYRTWKLGYKDTLASYEPWMSSTGAPPSSRNSAPYRQYLKYYVGDANGANVDYGPAGIPEPPFTAPFTYYDGATKSWVTDPNAEYESAFYANRANRHLLSTFGGVWQGFLLDDRIVPVIGLRHDYNRSRDSDSAINPTSATNGFYNTSTLDAYGAYDWVKDSGDTYSQGVIGKPFRWLGLMYNQSDSFSPGSIAYDVYGHPLPDPHGKTRDYGFELHFLGNRLALRAQQYETTDYGRGSSSINTIVQRAARMDYGTSSGDPNLTSWLANEYTQLHPDWTADQVNAAVIQASGVDPATIAGHINHTHGDQTVATSRGKEVEIEYNPSAYWTMKCTATQTLAFNAQMSGEVQKYIAQRLPTWTTVKGPFSGNLWWTTPIGGSGATTPQSWYTTNVLANLDLAIATQGKIITQVRQYHFSYLTKYKLAGLGFDNWLKDFDVGGAFRWESKASIGYFGAAADSDGVVRNLDPNRPIWSNPQASVDLEVGCNLRLFNDKVPVRIQLNVRNVSEGGRLQAVAVNPDGAPWAFRIIDPREFFLTTTFGL